MNYAGYERARFERKYMEMFFSNGMVAITVIFLLAIGATIPMFIFHRKAFSLTRHKN